MKASTVVNKRKKVIIAKMITFLLIFFFLGIGGRLVKGVDKIEPENGVWSGRAVGVSVDGGEETVLFPPISA
jgi:hypothetical protein